ncbi:4Fe-4S dicluster domain-containing protein [Natroniella sulfidigena]|uniref:4Fe-4S dicluster domain-containing protein n=1 Tax=Natroniella sulfidigena TaxID=723921 RepID=UPI00200A1548|nr:4Fe-4S dicluster domain-containing protein [Natroniella sulfidigena]MCK8817274.1 4Fe-4S dicluster domain-containing protein [Natroniella sulfidigena]
MADYYTGRTKDGAKYRLMFVSGVNWDKCVGCGICIKVCANKILKFVNTEKGTKTTVVNRGDCLGEGHCIKLCPNNAINYEFLEKNKA